jgi:hypothetical protein
VAWSPDGRQLATASSDLTVRIWDGQTGTELIVLRGHDDEVRWVAWSPDGRQLATASHDQTGRIWDAENGSELVVLHGHDNWVVGVAWSPMGGGWPPRQAIGRSGYGIATLGQRSSSSVPIQAELKAYPGPRMAGELPQLPRTGPVEYGMRRSASSNSCSGGRRDSSLDHQRPQRCSGRALPEICRSAGWGAPAVGSAGPSVRLDMRTVVSPGPVPQHLGYCWPPTGRGRAQRAVSSFGSVGPEPATERLPQSRRTVPVRTERFA